MFYIIFSLLGYYVDGGSYCQWTGGYGASYKDYVVCDNWKLKLDKSADRAMDKLIEITQTHSWFCWPGLPIVKVAVSLMNSVTIGNGKF